jgi:hypothetical protein
MPEKRIATRGNASFEAVKTGELRPPEERIKLVSCAPPPRGSITRFNPELKAAPRFDPAFLQQSEVTRLQAACKIAGDAADPSIATILAHIAAEMKFAAFDIDLGRLPAEWDEVVSCFDVTVASIVIFHRWEVTAKATAAVTVGGETYPAGDTLAAFHILVPRWQRFIRHFKWNPACCAGTPTERADELTDRWFPDKADKFELPPNWKPTDEYKPKSGYKFEPDSDVPPEEGGR